MAGYYSAQTLERLCIRNTLFLHPGDMLFDSRLRHLLFCLMYFVVSLILHRLSQSRNPCYFTAALSKFFLNPLSKFLHFGGGGEGGNFITLCMAYFKQLNVFLL